MPTQRMSEIVRYRDPLTLPPHTTVQDACQRMRDRRVGAVLVTNGDRRLVEASWTLGVSGFGTFRRVYLPLAAPATSATER